MRRGRTPFLCARPAPRLPSTGKTTNWLAVPAELRGGIFCVPVRFFAEAAGADVTWDAAGQTFYLTTAIQEG